MSELNRFEAELDSDIRGLERKLSLKQQQPQRRGRGEVLTLPSTHSDLLILPFFYLLHIFMSLFSLTPLLFYIKAPSLAV